MKIKTVSGAVFSIALASGAWTGCERGQDSGANLQENIERTVGDPQKSQLMLGGNGAPDDGGQACCSEATDAAAANAAADAGR
jgi:hypothetical protein